MQQEKKKLRNHHKTNPTNPSAYMHLFVCLFRFFVTMSQETTEGKLLLCRTMGSQSKSYICLHTLFQIHDLLSHFSLSVEQTLGWATV